jgi:hypothetical protein
MSDIKNKEQADRLLSALSEQLAFAGERFELVVVGGSGLLALGEIDGTERGGVAGRRAVVADP